MRGLQDTLVVTNAIQARHAETLRDHEELLNSHNKFLLAHEEAMMAHSRALRETDEYVAALRQQAEDWRIKTERNLLEITDKLNGLIGYLDGQHKPPQ
jgi:hypothetical protein